MTPAGVIHSNDQFNEALQLNSCLAHNNIVLNMF